MTHRQLRAWRMVSRSRFRFQFARTGGGAFVAFALTMLLAVSGVAAYPATDGPQLLVDTVSVAPGMPITATLNHFQPGQHVALHLRQSQLGDQGLLAVIFPGTVDAVGSGTVVVSTAGLPIGNYTVSVSVDGSSGDVEGAINAFAVVDPGFVGPRFVRTSSQPGD